jgi:hypothetical protein
MVSPSERKRLVSSLYYLGILINTLPPTPRSDFVYMVPPFLASYGVVTQNQSLIMESYNQIKLYRNYLRDGTKGGALWRHIVLGSNNDSTHWSTGEFYPSEAFRVFVLGPVRFSFSSTGNAWATAGITRVLATIQHSSFSGNFKSEMSDLAGWAREIIGGMYSVVVSSLTFLLTKIGLLLSLLLGLPSRVLRTTVNDDTGARIDILFGLFWVYFSPLCCSSFP